MKGGEQRYKPYVRIYRIYIKKMPYIMLGNDK